MALVSGAVAVAGWILRKYGWKIAVAALAAKELVDAKEQIVESWRGAAPDADQQIQLALAQLRVDPGFRLPPEVLAKLMMMNKDGPEPDLEVWSNPWDEVEELTRRECAAWSDFDGERC